MQSIRGFCYETAAAAVQSKKEKNLIKRLKCAHLTNSKLVNQISKLMDEIEQLKKVKVEAPPINLENVILKALEQKYPKLYDHLVQLSINAAYVDPRNNRFPQDLKLWYLHYATFGEALYNELSADFGFPVLRTVQGYKHDSIIESGLTMDILNGSPESIEQILSICWNETVDDDNRCVIAVDAASVTASVVVNQTGHVTGLTNPQKITKAARDALAEGIDAFTEFIEANKTEICKYYFLCYLNPLSPNRKPFPIVALKTVNGNAKEDVITFVSQLISLFQANFNNIISIIGIAFDGDPGWLHLLKPILDTIPVITQSNSEEDHQQEGILRNLEDFKIPLSNLLAGYDGLLPFEDILHLLKCGRYRIINNPTFCTWPSLEQHNFDRNNLTDIGIPAYILDDSKCKKMEDLYPLMMFNYKILDNIVTHKPELLPIFAPLTLLEEAIFNQSLTRAQRLQNITSAFSFMMLYKEEIKLKQSKKENCVFDTIFCNKFISLCQVLSAIISSMKAVHLGALGTHWLEHFFGQIRQLCKGDDSVDRVEQALVHTILNKYLANKTGREVEQKKRKSRSDSGCILVEENQEIMEPEILDLLIQAFVTIRFCHEICNQSVIDLLTPYGEVINEVNHAFIQMPDTFMEYIFHSTSTKQLKMQGGGGYTSFDRVLSGQVLGTV